MLLVAPVKKNRCIEMPDNHKTLPLKDRVNIPRSDVPAITHLDYSARVQTVNKEQNSIYYRLLKKFEEKSGSGVIVNTSFNVRGEPIVCTPEDAFRCFMRTQMDYLVMGNFLLDKKKQKPMKHDVDWQKEFELD